MDVSRPIYSLLCSALPSFILRRIRPDEFSLRRRSSTAWLDGLRGTAALIVVIFHFSLEQFGWYMNPYGFGDKEQGFASSPLQLPFVRVILAGPAMVSVFFVVSGFALSYKPLRQIRAHDYQALQATLSSSTFRRAFRLFIPVIVVSIMIGGLAHFGGWSQPLQIQQFSTVGEAIYDCYKNLWIILDPWRIDIFHAPPYNVHFWTIPIEFNMSLLLFVILSALSRCDTRYRFTVSLVLMAYFLKTRHWAPFEFLAGMCLAEKSLIRDEKEHEYSLCPSSPFDSEKKTTSPRRSGSAAALAIKIVLIANLVFALFAVGSPLFNPMEAPGISWLFSHTMAPFGTGNDIGMYAMFWHAIGAVQIVAAVQEFTCLQSLFLSPLAQYLGDISFSLYLCHGPILKIFVPYYLPYL